MLYSAFLFDLNGTMVDDMEYHVKAWYDILNNDLQAGLDWPQVREQMYGKNSELLDRVFGANAFDEKRVHELSFEKERRYQSAYLPHLSLIAGLDAFMEKAEKQGISMAIGSAAIPFNIDFVLDNLHIRNRFKTIVSADDVAISKPHPETYLKAAAILNVPPSACVVFEDAPKGVEAAQNAGMKAVVITTMHEAHEFSAYSNILAFVKDYTDPVLNKLLFT
ncbi:MAG: HAD family phosphatase [Chitinophagaceae bacterium]